MGAYLNKPVIEKEKEEGSGDGFSYACTTMQGWRANQEDAHNCVVDLHDGWHMFAVYDGHGGTEVSKFTSKNLPNFLKDRKFWDAKDISDCLQNAFVDFDDFIRSEDSMKQLKNIANEGGRKKSIANDSEDEADRIDTIEESSIPLADLIKRYGAAGSGMGLGRSLLSAFLSRGDAEDSDSDEDEEDEEEEEDGEEEVKEGEEGETEDKEKENEEEDKDAVKPDEAQESEESQETEESGKSEGDKKKVQKRCSKSPIQSAAKKSKSSETAAATSSSSTGESDAAAKEEDDDSDQEFVADEEEEVDEEQSDEEMEEEGTDIGQFLAAGGAETPGEDSGTTACVCLVGKEMVVVANAGDSRAVLCRAGKAVDLSVDHKPEDEVETNRIHAAGGVIEEGRVNGGLNLSRALGDHAYKKNNSLSLKEQMITAFPDVKVEKLTPEDEFIVVACDGIWNSMESQQVVDFVRDLIAKKKTCAEICDALCDACLADSTDGDGTGCDNMTVICTTFNR